MWIGNPPGTRYLRDPHENAAVVLADVEVEVLVLDADVATFRQLAAKSAVFGSELLEQVGQGVTELDHALRRNGDLRSGTTTSHRLGHLGVKLTTLRTKPFNSVFFAHFVHLKLASPQAAQLSLNS